MMDRPQKLSIELEEYTQADHDYKTTISTVLSVARRASDIFERSEPREKRQFINFLVQNPKMHDRELVFELRKPMNSVLELANEQNKTIGISTDDPIWLRIATDIGTAIRGYQGYIHIPKLTVADLIY